MELLIISLLIIPFAMACFAGLYGLLQHAAQAAHNRWMERLRTEGEVYKLQPDLNGNMPAIYVPEIGRVIHPNSGNQGPQYPLLTNFTYSPNKSTAMSGKPLQLGGDQPNQSALVINRWRGQPNDYSVTTDQPSQEGQETPELPETTEDNPQVVTPEDAAKHLLSNGRPIMEVAAATGLTEWAVRKIKAGLK